MALFLVLRQLLCQSPFQQFLWHKLNLLPPNRLLLQLSRRLVEGGSRLLLMVGVEEIVLQLLLLQPQLQQQPKPPVPRLTTL